MLVMITFAIVAVPLADPDDVFAATYADGLTQTHEHS